MDSDWEWVMRVLIMLGKSTTSGFSMMWPRNSPSRLSQRVEISGLGSSRMWNSGSRNSGKCLTISESGTLSSRLIQDTRNCLTNLSLVYILSLRIGTKATTSNFLLSVTMSLRSLSSSSEPFLTFWSGSATTQEMELKMSVKSGRTLSRATFTTL